MKCDQLKTKLILISDTLLENYQLIYCNRLSNFNTFITDLGCIVKGDRSANDYFSVHF